VGLKRYLKNKKATLYKTKNIKTFSKKDGFNDESYTFYE